MPAVGGALTPYQLQMGDHLEAKIRKPIACLYHPTWEPFVGSIKWRGRATFGGRDLGRIAAQRGPWHRHSAGTYEVHGDHYAMTEGVLILATIAQRYRLLPVPEHSVEPQLLLTLKPKAQLFLRDRVVVSLLSWTLAITLHSKLRRLPFDELPRNFYCVGLLRRSAKSRLFLCPQLLPHQRQGIGESRIDHRPVGGFREIRALDGSGILRHLARGEL